MSAPPDMVALFRQKYEEVAGRVYLAATPATATEIVKDIFTTSFLSKPVLAPLPGSLADAIASFLKQAEISPVSLELDNDALQHAIAKADVGLSVGDFGIASTGTVVEVTTEDAYRLVSSLPRVHIAFLSANEIVEFLNDSIPRLRQVYRDNSQGCNITFISGPSRTADIEMKLFLGVHGPQESHVIVCDWEFT